MTQRRLIPRRYEAQHVASLVLLEPIGDIPSAEAEERYYAMLEHPTMAA